MEENNSYRKLDEELLHIRRYCHPDAPTEYIVISKNSLPHKKYKNSLMAELYGESKSSVKVSLKTLVNGREVELIKDPLLDSKLEVVIKRQPRNTILTFREVFEILHTVEELLGVEIGWKRAFPRGSC